MPNRDMRLHSYLRIIGHRMKQRPESALADVAAVGFLKQANLGRCNVLSSEHKGNLRNDPLFGLQMGETRLMGYIKGDRRGRFLHWRNISRKGRTSRVRDLSSVTTKALILTRLSNIHSRPYSSFVDLVNPDSFSVGERLPSLRRTLHTGKVWPEQGDMAYVAIKVFLQPANDVVVHAATARCMQK